MWRKEIWIKEHFHPWALCTFPRPLSLSQVLTIWKQYRLELQESPHFPPGNFRYNASVPSKSLKITCESLVFVWQVILYPVGCLFVISRLPWPGAVRHVPHLGYLTNWHSATWSVQLSLSNTRSMTLQEARPGASVGRQDLPGRCDPGGKERKKESHPEPQRNCKG